MNYISHDHFFEIVINWIENRLPKNDETPELNLMIPYLNQGGWEGWVQVELAMFSAMNYIDVQREQRIYGDDSLKVDLLFNGTASQECKRIAVEIKCQSVYNNAQRLKYSVNCDILKLQDLDPDVYDRCLLLFVIDQSTLDYFINKEFQLIYGNDAIAALVKKV